MRHLGLFEGIGGFSLAARWMGWKTMAWVEWNKYCQQILKQHFQEAFGFGDIRKFSYAVYKSVLRHYGIKDRSIDITSGGFPCQPFSVAGKREGANDDRFLWPENRRINREFRPKCIVLENVAGLFTILEPESLSEMEHKEVQLFCESEEYPTNETIERVQRRVIARIIEEIRADGYVLPTLADGTPIILCIPACAVNAPHRRDRLWIVAFDTIGKSNGRRNTGTSESFRMDMVRDILDKTGWIKSADNIESSSVDVADTANNGCKRKDWSDNRSERGVLSEGIAAGSESMRCGEAAANSNNEGIQGGAKTRDTYEQGTETIELIGRHDQPRDWQDFPTQSPVCGGNDGIPDRVDRIKALGNAIVPQVAFEIFKAIENLNHYGHTQTPNTTP
jgi:DNA (cytosine-5)-methyltransferase 1